MRNILRAICIATICSTIALVAVMLLNKPPLYRYYVVAYREYQSPTADDGFPGLGDGLRSPQSFYWDEITSSKELQTEVLKEMGEGLSYPFGLPSLSADKFLEAEGRRSPEGLFLVLNFSDFEHTEESARSFGPTALADFAISERAFLQVIGRKGATLQPVGPVRYFWKDRWLNAETISFYAWLIFPVALLASCVSLVRFSLRRKNHAAPAAGEPPAEGRYQHGDPALEPRLPWPSRLRFSLASFAAGLVAAGVIVAASLRFEVFSRDKDRRDSVLEALEDPTTTQRFVKQIEEMQKNALATKLHAVAIRADFSLQLLSDPAASESSLDHGAYALAEFLESERDWNQDQLTHRLVTPLLRPTREKVMAFLKGNPGVKEKVDAYQRKLRGENPAAENVSA